MKIYVVYRENEFGDFEILCWTDSKYRAGLYVNQQPLDGFWSYYYKEAPSLDINHA